MANPKIISLLPAATEIICALGLQEHLVGRSHECDFPEGIQQLPVCSEAKFLPGADSLAIDTQVKDILAASLSIYQLDKKLITELAPDVIITQAQCEVCAVSLKDVEDALSGLLAHTAKIISLQPKVLEDIFTDIQTTADFFSIHQKGIDVVEELNERIAIIRHKLKFKEVKPKVVCVEWLAPLMVAGNWTPELVEIAGGTAVLAENGKHSPFINFDSILAENPEIIVVMPCGFSIQRTLAEMHLLLDLPGWTELQAVKNKQVYIADGNQYFNRSGPRIVDSIEILAEIINPRQFAFGYEGNGWLKFG